MDEVRALGRAITKTIFLSAGNITHTPLYGHLIAMGVLAAAETRNAPMSPASRIDSTTSTIAARAWRRMVSLTVLVDLQPVSNV